MNVNFDQIINGKKSAIQSDSEPINGCFKKDIPTGNIYFFNTIENLILKGWISKPKKNNEKS